MSEEVPVFAWNTKTKEFFVLGHKFEGVNSIEEFIDFITNLQKENQQLKEQLNQKLTPNELVDMLNQELAKQLQQRDEIIEKAVEFLKEFHNFENRFKWCEQDYIDTINKLEEILIKYKGDNNE